MIATLIVLAIYAYGAWKASTAALSLFLLLLQIAEFAVRTLFGVLWYIPSVIGVLRSPPGLTPFSGEPTAWLRLLSYLQLRSRAASAAGGFWALASSIFNWLVIVPAVVVAVVATASLLHRVQLLQPLLYVAWRVRKTVVSLSLVSVSTCLVDDALKRQAGCGALWPALLRLLTAAGLAGLGTMGVLPHTEDAERIRLRRKAASLVLRISGCLFVGATAALLLAYSAAPHLEAHVRRYCLLWGCLLGGGAVQGMGIVLGVGKPLSALLELITPAINKVVGVASRACKQVARQVLRPLGRATLGISKAALKLDKSAWHHIGQALGKLILKLSRTARAVWAVVSRILTALYRRAAALYRRAHALYNKVYPTLRGWALLLWDFISYLGSKVWAVVMAVARFNWRIAQRGGGAVSRAARAVWRLVVSIARRIWAAAKWAWGLYLKAASWVWRQWLRVVRWAVRLAVRAHDVAERFVWQRLLVPAAHLTKSVVNTLWARAGRPLCAWSKRQALSLFHSLIKPTSLRAAAAAKTTARFFGRCVVRVARFVRRQLQWGWPVGSLACCAGFARQAALHGRMVPFGLCALTSAAAAALMIGKEFKKRRRLVWVGNRLEVAGTALYCNLDLGLFRVLRLAVRVLKPVFEVVLRASGNVITAVLRLAVGLADLVFGSLARGVGALVKALWWGGIVPAAKAVKHVLYHGLKSIWNSPELSLAASLALLASIYAAHAYGLGPAAWARATAAYLAAQSAATYILTWLSWAVKLALIKPAQAVGVYIGWAASYAGPGAAKAAAGSGRAAAALAAWAGEAAGDVWSGVFGSVWFSHTFYVLNMLQGLVVRGMRPQLIQLEGGIMGTLRQRAAASFFARSTLKALLGPLWFASATSLATDALKQYKQHVLAGTGASVAGGRASSAVAVVVGRVLVAAGLEWWAGPAVRMAHWLACSTPLWWFAYLFLVWVEGGRRLLLDGGTATPIYASTSPPPPGVDANVFREYERELANHELRMAEHLQQQRAAAAAAAAATTTATSASASADRRQRPSTAATSTAAATAAAAAAPPAPPRMPQSLQAARDGARKALLKQLHALPPPGHVFRDADDNTCTICFCELPPNDHDSTRKDDVDNEEAAEVLLCGHVFHRGCVLEWLLRNQRGRCPVCREQVLGVGSRANVLF